MEHEAFGRRLESVMNHEFEIHWVQKLIEFVEEWKKEFVHETTDLKQ